MKKRGLRVLITCGPTREPLDPVRFFSNYSTGAMGLALLRASRARGHRVTLVHGAVPLPRGLGARLVAFDTVAELQAVLTREVRHCDILFMAAAVSDYRARKVAHRKIKKNGRFFQVVLVQNPDILKSLKGLHPHGVRVGFCLESTDLYRRALQKMTAKDLDLIVAQKVENRIRPFGNRSIDALLVRRGRERTHFRRISKPELAQRLVREATRLFREKVGTIT